MGYLFLSSFNDYGVACGMYCDVLWQYTVPGIFCNRKPKILILLLVVLAGSSAPVMLSLASDRGIVVWKLATLSLSPSQGLNCSQDGRPYKPTI